MTVGVPQFQGMRLKEARLARGLFKKSLADMVGITGTAITRYEEGEDKPQLDKLDALALRLNFPIDFFLKSAWPEELGVIFWRSRSNETKYAREMTEQRMSWLCEIFAFLEEEVNFPSQNLPEFDLPSDVHLITPDLIERAAVQLREHWCLRDRPIPDVLLALENAGIPTVQLDIASDKQDGFCFRSNRLNRFFVGINVYEVSAVRARYDASHELGHAILHQHVSPQHSRDPATHRLLEQQAHRFAGAFLFPREAFLSEVAIPSLDYFSNLKKRWGMSIGAMVFRASNLGLIDDFDKSNLYQNMTRRGWRGALREPFDSHSEMPLERPRMLRRAIETVLNAGIFGRSAILSSLALPQMEIEQIVGLPKGSLEETEVFQLPISPRTGGLRAVDLESGNVIEFPHRKNK